MRRIIDGIIAALFLVIAILLIDMGVCNRNYANAGIVLLVLSLFFAILHIVWLWKPDQQKNIVWSDMAGWSAPGTALTELVLLGEDGTRLASWNIYGKNGVVIGRDIGENHVTVNLNNVTYASMIDIEHAVLNYSGDSWYIEDVSEKNGISIEKIDGKKYKIAYGKPCKLERGDIIHIALTRLQIF